MAEQKLVIDSLATYLAMIRGAVGAKLFQHLIAKSNEGPVDILRGGDVACAVFVSSILALNGRINWPHATVAATVKAMKERGWTMVPLSSVVPGDVIVWGARQSDPEQHTHIGFVIGEGRAISNSATERVPVEHDLLFQGERTVTETLHWPDWTIPAFPD